LVPLVSYQIHERINGSGYPRGRSEENIHPFARILYVADRYVSLTSLRPHRQPLTPYAAMETLLKSEEERGADPLVVRALLRVISLFPVVSWSRYRMEAWRMCCEATRTATTVRLWNWCKIDREGKLKAKEMVRSLTFRSRN
jgi:hypothetical protein